MGATPCWLFDVILFKLTDKLTRNNPTTKSKLDKLDE